MYFSWKKISIIKLTDRPGSRTEDTRESEDVRESEGIGESVGSTGTEVKP